MAELQDKQSTGFFGQPFALANLFGVEMWERFSFYGMQGILIYYLYYSVSEGGLGIPESSATSIVGAYGGTVYLSTILGAWIADRLLGSERTLFYSAIMIMFGHIALAVLPGFLGVGVGLILVAFGSGGLKANATSLVGDLYDEHDTRRDAGFSLFYMGINIGAFIGPLLTGLAWDKLGFHAGFGLAAIGMALGLIQYTIGRKHLLGIGATPPHPLPASDRMKWGAIGVAAIVVVALLSVFGAITASNLSDVVVGVTIVAAVAYFSIILSSKHITQIERRRVISFIPMFIASAAFWSLFQQQFTTVPLIADTELDRNLFGWDFPPSWVQSINPVFIIIFAGVFAAMWTKLGDRQPSTPLKFAAGVSIMGLAFLAFVPSLAGDNMPLLALVGILLLFTFAELFLSPVGLSLSTKLAPKNFHTQMVALFFLSVALGSAMAGTLAGYYDQADPNPFFYTVGGVSIAVGIVIAAMSPWIKKMMSGVQ
ncbi:peptide MFS transporter [Rhodococcus sp. BP-252]|uniref:peptide MFS transporter n=1 Tax=unclassified Rhodococcus (in: high G+C Gram-positive bacteria) TaxID=192944 RepID=UPI001C9B59C2|nr:MULTISPECIES: peptide MFS transporter [unclassified Rhodococcus (in: high G+C Gram-positive bacteria)]MBY6412948.1 peptide MFS transporter [Rhodococcus sp. BP-320]MBY6419450.1 peptide MFS transporter [Rhodococcus sp. BP-321]MBY6423858.1 peptide MFS transporter [Rhodococcus sp. BP-324]MBY6429132.1 peptide MFS transporter [Rhodococcus sp. BP-323]MBY6432870.1 peptide MFS transporter [Rhodococcus sp. BP-322]